MIEVELVINNVNVQSYACSICGAFLFSDDDECRGQENWAFCPFCGQPLYPYTDERYAK